MASRQARFAVNDTLYPALRCRRESLKLTVDDASEVTLFDVRCWSSAGPVAQRLEQRTHNALCNRRLLCFSSTYEANGWIQLGRFGHGCGGFGLDPRLITGTRIQRCYLVGTCGVM